MRISNSGMQILLKQRSAQGCNVEILNVNPRSYDIQMMW